MLEDDDFSSLLCHEHPQPVKSHAPVEESSIRDDLTLELLNTQVSEIITQWEAQLNDIVEKHKEYYLQQFRAAEYSAESIEAFMRETDALTHRLTDLELSVLAESEMLYDVPE
jgi:hypothetical protein